MVNGEESENMFEQLPTGEDMNLPDMMNVIVPWRILKMKKLLKLNRILTWIMHRSLRQLMKKRKMEM